MQSIWTGQQIQGGRDYQEDYFAIVENNTVFYKGEEFSLGDACIPKHHSLYLLTDGMGGESHGDLAAEIVIETFIESYTSSTNQEQCVTDKLSDSLNKANDELALLVDGLCQQENKSEIVMGCTIIAVLWDCEEKTIQWLSVGDSPLWLYRDKKLQQLNERHVCSVEAEKKKSEGIPFDEDYFVNNPTALTSVVMGKQIDSIDLPTTAFKMRSGDLLFLASDGMELLSFFDIELLLIEFYQKIINTEDVHKAFESLNDARREMFRILKLKSDMNQDNTTLILSAFI